MMMGKIMFGQVRVYLGDSPDGDIESYPDRVGKKFIVQEINPEEPWKNFIRWEDGWVEDVWTNPARDDAALGWIQKYTRIVGEKDEQHDG